LGLAPHEAFELTYVIYDLKQNSVAWREKIALREKVELGEKTGKELLEKDNLTGLKSRVEKMTRERFKVRSGRGVYGSSIGQLVGLE
jgi:hypothetical protein